MDWDKQRDIFLQFLSQGTKRSMKVRNLESIIFGFQSQFRSLGLSREEIIQILDKLKNEGMIVELDIKGSSTSIYKITDKCLNYLSGSTTKDTPKTQNEVYHYLEKRFDQYIREEQPDKASFYLRHLLLQRYYKIDYLRCVQLLNILAERIDKKKTVDNETKWNFQLCDAMIKLAHERLYTKMKAQPLLLELIDNKDVEYDTLAIALRQYSKLLILELKATENQNLIQHIQSISYRMETLGNEFHDIPMVIHSQLLRTKMNLLNGNITKVEEIFLDLEEMVDQRNFPRLKELIETEHNQFKEQIRDWHNLTNSSQNLYERFKLSKIEEYIEKAKTYTDVELNRN